MTSYTLGTIENASSTSAEVDEEYFGIVTPAGQEGLETGSDLGDAIELIGATSIRFPGGTEAWKDFEWRRPDDPDFDSSKQYTIEDLHNAIDYCAENGLSLSYTFPTREFYQQADLSVDTARIKQFIKDDLLQYAMIQGVEVSAVKIGNEYYIREDQQQMEDSEYGRIASHLSAVIGEAFDEFMAGGDVDPAFTEPKLLIESGQYFKNLGNNGSFIPRGGTDADKQPDTTDDAFDIISEFSAYEAQFVDGIDIHVRTLKVDYADFFGTGASNWSTNREVLERIISDWNTYDTNNYFTDIEAHVLAWSYPERSDEGASLVFSSLSFMQIHNMSMVGVESAYNFQVAGNPNNSSNSLYNRDTDMLRAGGEVYRLMSENLRGMTAVDITNDPTAEGDIVIRSFVDDGQVVLYVGNLSGSQQDIDLAIQTYLQSIPGFSGSYEHLWATSVGVIGDANDFDAVPVLEILNEADLQVGGNPWQLSFTLEAHEIIQIVVSDGNVGATMNGHLQDDTLIGSAHDDELAGREGDDTIRGEGGDDIIHGGAGDDRVFSGSGSDEVYLGDGNDYVRVGGGVESFDGGAGTDYISYYDSTNGITANLELNTVSGSWAVNDTINSFESISGSRTGDDEITGTSGANTIRTYGGDDRVYAGSGSDTVELGSGNDYVRVGGGVESFDGGGGTDYISYYDSSNGITIDLEADTVSGSWAVNDTISNFESASGSGTGDDKMYGTSGANTLRGFGGNDKLYGRSGDDKLYGGSGNDRFDGGAGTDRLWGDAGEDVFHLDFGEGHDIIEDFENNVDLIQLDNFTFAPNEDAFDFATQVGDDVVFDFGGGDGLTVRNVTIAQLTNDLVLV